MAKPVPEADRTTRFYWDAAAEGRLEIQRCSSCERYVFPPTVVCPRCLTETLIPTEVSGRGTVYAFTVARQAFDPSFIAPYILALVELAEDPEVRVLSNIVDAEPDEVAAGAPVEVDFEARDGSVLPQFKVAGRPR